MDIVTDVKQKNKRYLPHELTTRINSVKLYQQTKDIDFVLRRYHISKASLMRWNKQYDGTKESLMSKSHRPRSPHHNAHTEEELGWIRNYHRRNPNISICELYGKLRQEKAYSRHPGSLYRVFIRLGYRKKVESTKKKSKHLGHYDTPTELGKKWQMDVKYVPIVCYVGTDGEKFYQYTMIEEATRERFIYAYKENSSYSTVDFVQRAIIYFGYAPDMLQTDNGGEFTHTQKTKRIHPLDVLCNSLHITHKTIRPATPWHNGKVERSHRNDQERFYNHLSFYSYEDLQIQMKRVMFQDVLCEVNGYNVEKYVSGGEHKYLDVAFNDFVTTEEMGQWLLAGSSFECLIYVDEIPSATYGIISNVNKGGAGVQSRAGCLIYSVSTNDISGTEFASNKCVANTSMYVGVDDDNSVDHFNAGQLTHIVATYDPETNKVSIYKDGVLISDGEYGNGTALIKGNSIDGHIAIGTDSAGATQFALDNGTGYSIVDVKFYSDALDAKAVAELYEKTADKVLSNALNIPVEDITLNKTELNLNDTQVGQLTATLAPEDATNKTLIWTSSDESVATVDENGLVTPVGQGTAKITVVSKNGDAAAECTVNVFTGTINVTGVKFERNAVAVTVNKNAALNAIVEPEYDTNLMTLPKLGYINFLLDPNICFE